MDISKLNELNAAENGITHEFELTHPVNGKGIGIKLKLISREADAPRNLGIRLADKMRVAEAKAQRTGKAGVSFAEIEQQGIDLLAACVVGWEGVEEKGKPVEFSTAAVKEHLLGINWVREQINAQLDEQANFIAA
ncbi:hypothetical protein KRX19_05550 [Cardiobacteriaceae bacterium TAE3-ERU3]|nr:hypothetical protein [Cardiobacteriaceae bacterium TAE3-ERU3]